ncbi:hypothetical protein IFM89_011858 [Coptis chinensis]|uniref:Uncharacterized protein n=1 Tax=Coptis chinensis TaxID=261450 RepID=A0A835HZ66_9MAGN|nr:hypothetical protein IFM89_011858 [Coptis chinensis]
MHDASINREDRMFDEVGVDVTRGRAKGVQRSAVAHPELLVKIQLVDNYLTIILDGISVRACSKGFTESGMNSLQSIFVKLLAYYSYLEDAFALNHFVEILRVMYGSTRDVVYMQIVSKAAREGYIRNPTTIQLLFEVSLALHDRIDILDIKDDYYQQCAHLISRFIHMEVLVHSSNNLAVKAIKDANGVVSFLKSCIAFNEVTIPSISATTTKMNLYLETVEVALLGGLLSHTDDLIDLAIGCLQSLNQSDGSLLQDDMNELLSLIRKLCSLLVIIPVVNCVVTFVGNLEQGVAYLSRSILSLVESHLWMAPQLRLRVFCAILSLAATLSQNKFPYHACNKEVVGNDLLFFGDCTYRQELASMASTVLTKVFQDVLQESHQVTRGSMALEACNCILSSVKANDEILDMCSKLIEIAKSCLDSSDNCLRSTVCLLDKHLSPLSGEGDVPSSSYGNTL